MNQQFGMVKEEVLDQSLLYHPIQSNAEAIYPSVMEEFEKKKEDVDAIQESL